MKKSLITLAVLAASGAAMAQSSVTLYGRLDAGVGRTSKETTGAVPVAKVTNTVIDNSNLNTTFWGLKGSEDMGGGLKANFDLQSGFALDTGVGNVGLFERKATVGLSGGFGAVDLGRQYTAYDDLRGATNNTYDSNFATTSGSTGVWRTGIKDYSNRVSNSIGYRSPSFGGISGGVVIGLGENKTSTLSADENISLHVKYAAGPLLVGVAYQEEKAQNGTLATTNAVTGVVTPGAAATSSATTKYSLIGASYDFGVAKLTGSYNQAKNGTVKDKEFQTGVSVPFGAAAIAVGYSRAKSDATGNDNDGKGYSLVGTYNLSKRTTLYAGYMNIKVEANNGATEAKNSKLATGVRHTF